MTAVEEPPLPTSGPWATAPTLRLAVVGAAGLAARLGRLVPVRTVGPRDDMRDACRDTDAVLLELSAFESATGPWAHALRPVGFDRGGALAQLLRVARLFERPVLAVDDRPLAGRDGWQDVLAATLDDVAPLGPVVAGAPGWNPGVHLAPSALAVPRSGPTGAPIRPGPDEDWAAVQRRAVLAGAAEVDLDDPWQQHLAEELLALGVAVTDTDGTAVRPGTGVVDPSEALDLLRARLGLRAAARPAPLVVTSAPAEDGTHETVDVDGLRTATLAVDRPVVVVAPDATASDDEVAAALRALDRAGGEAVVRPSGSAVVAADGRTLRTLGEAREDLHARLVRIAGEVTS